MQRFFHSLSAKREVQMEFELYPPGIAFDPDRARNYCGLSGWGGFLYLDQHG